MRHQKLNTQLALILAVPNRQAMETTTITSHRRNRFPHRYRMHQYWARKPWYVIRENILRYTSPGDTILDPFVGSGVTLALANEISPQRANCYRFRQR